MRQDFCDVTVLLDRSGSMSPIRMDTIGGFNTFLEKQRTLPGQCTLSLIQFDDRYEPNYEGVAIVSASMLTMQTYEPRGSTALNDAVMKAIARTGERLSAMPEPSRPGKVVFVIITDGHENASQVASKQDVLKKIHEQEERWKWEFVYIGAFADAFDEAGSIGIKVANTLRTDKSPAGTVYAYHKVGQALTSFRTAGAAGADSMAFTKEQQEEQDRDAQAQS